jgi:hypothetical protein
MIIKQMPTKKQSILSYDNCIKFNFKDFNKNYWVEITIKQEEEESNIITYNVNVDYTKEHNQPYYLVQVTTTNFLLNFDTPESMLQEIALTCRKAYEKCIFQVDGSNKIIALHNHADIVNHWKTIKVQLQQENEGETFEQYIALFEKSILDKDKLLQKLKKDTFINQYFFPIFEQPYHDFERKGVAHFSFFNFDYEQEILLRVEKEGIFNDTATALLTKTLIRNEKNTLQFPITSYETTYKFNAAHAIQEVKGEFVNHNKEYLFKIELEEKPQNDTLK